MADRLRWRRRGAREDKDTAGAGRQAFLGPGSDYVNHPRYMADPTAGRVFRAGQSRLGRRLLSTSANTAQIATRPNTFTIAENELNGSLVADHGGEREIGGIVGELVAADGPVHVRRSRG